MAKRALEINYNDAAHLLTALPKYERPPYERELKRLVQGVNKEISSLEKTLKK